MEHLTVYLEKVWHEYVEYKEFLKNISKPPEQLKKEVAEKITNSTTTEQAIEIVCNVMEKQNLHQEDFSQQIQRLFYTVEAVKSTIEVPQEILKEVEKLSFIQIFAIKDKKEIIINQEALDFKKKQIKSVMEGGVQEFKKRFL